MVIGTGLVANAFKEQYHRLDGFLIFAAGVSNSKTSTAADFRREEDLLRNTLQQHPDKQFVYFSTCSITDPDLRNTTYVQHKLQMEELIAAKAGHYRIFRLSNLAGFSQNPHTILNYFYQHIAHSIPFQLWKYSERNIIDVDDAFRVADHILQHELFANQVINIANTSNYPVGYIVECIETFCGKKAIYEEKEKGDGIHIDLSEVQPIYQALQLDFGKDYLPRLLEKYFS